MFFYNVIAPWISIVTIHIIAVLGVMQITAYPK